MINAIAIHKLLFSEMCEYLFLVDCGWLTMTI